MAAQRLLWEDLSKTCGCRWSWASLKSSVLLSSSVLVSSTVLILLAAAVVVFLRQNISRFCHAWWWNWKLLSRDFRNQSQEPTKTKPPPLNKITRLIVMTIIRTKLLLFLILFEFPAPAPLWRFSLIVRQPSGSMHFTVHSLVGSFPIMRGDKKKSLFFPQMLLFHLMWKNTGFSWQGEWLLSKLFCVLALLNYTYNLGNKSGEMIFLALLKIAEPK